MANFYQSYQAAAGASLTIMALASAATLSRAKVAHLILGSDTAPANTAGEFNVSRFTTAGITPTATLTPVVSDPVAAASGVTATGGTYATEPVYPTAPLGVMLMIPLNQQAQKKGLLAA